MFEQIIMMLIYLCIFVGICYLVIWVLGQLGISLPPMLIKIFWIIIGLIVLLMLWKIVGPSLSTGHLPGFK